MTQDELDKVVLKLLQKARTMLALSTGQFPHSLIGSIRNGHTTTLIARDLAQVTSEEAPAFVKALEAEYQFEWLAHVGDIWIKRMKREAVVLPLQPASSYADREDALVVEAKSGDLFACVCQIYRRDAKGRYSFEDEKVLSQGERRYSRILGVGEAPDRHKNPFDGITP